MSALSPVQQSAVLGLCRERVPLGVQARGLKLDRRHVKAAALDFLKAGDIGELPADDIRAGQAFSWPEIMLPDAPDFEDEAPLTLPCTLVSVTIPAAPNPLVASNLPSRYWGGRRLSDRHLIVARALAEVPAGACVSIADLAESLEAHGYSGVRRSVQVCTSELRRLGFVIDFDIDGDGYVMSNRDRAKWIGGDHA